MAIPQLRFVDLLEAARDSRLTQELVRRASFMNGPNLMGLGLSFYLAESAPAVDGDRPPRAKEAWDARALHVGCPHRTGSERTLATIISKKLRIGRSGIEVRFGDTTTSHLGIGTLSSRSITYAGSAALLACQLLVDRIKERLRGPSRGGPAYVTFAGGAFHVRYEDGRRRKLDFVDVAKELGKGMAVEATVQVGDLHLLLGLPHFAGGRRQVHGFGQGRPTPDLR